MTLTLSCFFLPSRFARNIFLKHRAATVLYSVELDLSHRDARGLEGMFDVSAKLVLGKARPWTTLCDMCVPRMVFSFSSRDCALEWEGLKDMIFAGRKLFFHLSLWLVPLGDSGA